MAVETEQRERTFVVPKTLDEWMVAGAFVAWPFIYIFLLRPTDANAFGDAVAFLLAFAVQVGIVFALRTARRRGA